MFFNSKAGEEKLYQCYAFIKLLYHVEQYVTIINSSYIYAFVTVCHENSRYYAMLHATRIRF